MRLLVYPCQYCCWHRLFFLLSHAIATKTQTMISPRMLHSHINLHVAPFANGHPRMGLPALGE